MKHRHMNARLYVPILAGLLAGSTVVAAQATPPLSKGDLAGLTNDFQSPPDMAQCWVYWYWFATPDKDSITRDLTAMREQGIKRVVTFGFKTYMSPEWMPLFEHTLKEAKRLGLQIILNHDTGWSFDVSWMSPELAQKKLVFSERLVEGGSRMTQALPAPQGKEGFYRDIAVLACRLASARPTVLDAAALKKYRSELDVKTARAMYPSYPGGGLDFCYDRSSAGAAADVIAAGDVLDISAKMSADGTLEWEAPAGRWKVLRFGYTVFHKTAPDFFDRRAIDRHLGQSVGKMLPAFREYVGTTWTHMHMDSYEVGAQSWTAQFLCEFQARRGYDMTPWMPVLAGCVVDSQSLSDRFLHDYRRTISDLYIDHFFKPYASYLKEMGLELSSEAAYGWASPIADGLRIFECTDLPMGEFWHPQRHPVTGQWCSVQFAVHKLDPADTRSHRAIPYGLGLNSVRMASSASHIYGKSYSRAESFTSYLKEGYDLCNAPFSLKETVDRAFCDGLGGVVLHCYIGQTGGDDKPGDIWGGVGLQFTRNITWWNQANAFTKYLSRCQVLLRQGKFVADFAYWTGDTIPYECPDRTAMRPALPSGCNADLVNTDVLMNRMTVKDGRLVLPDGVSYRYLVLPPTRQTVEPASLRRIRDLVEGGATVVLGPRPVSAAGLSNHPQCDDEVKALADVLWSAAGSLESGQRSIGKGRVVWGWELAALLKDDGFPQDVEVDGKGALSPFEWIHYRAGEREIYFLSNQTDTEKIADLSFRVIGKQPELWDPVCGTQRVLSQFSVQKDHTVVPLHFAAKQSFFLVFSPEAKPQSDSARNFPALKKVMELSGDWEVSFDSKWGGPGKTVFSTLQDWTTRLEVGIKYYSGTATYRKAFDLPDNFAAGHSRSPVYLDLGVVKDLAEVRLNGKPLGVVWTAPWCVDISGVLNAKGNLVEILVVNQWPNRMIGDLMLPLEKRIAKATIKGAQSFAQTTLTSEDSLVPSGLLGPVTIQVNSAIEGK